MKAVLKISGIKNSKDVRKIQDAIASNDGVIASEVILDKKEIIIIYNENYAKIDNIIDSIDNLGYIVI